MDGDLLIHGSGADQPSKTELAVRSLVDQIDMDHRAIRRDLELGGEEAFGDSKLFKRVFALADKQLKSPVPRAVVPDILLESPKITRKLTTAWFASRVDDRYKKCLARGAAKK